MLNVAEGCARAHELIAQTLRIQPTKPRVRLRRDQEAVRRVHNGIDEHRRGCRCDSQHGLAWVDGGTIEVLAAGDGEFAEHLGRRMLVDRRTLRARRTPTEGVGAQVDTLGDERACLFSLGGGCLDLGYGEVVAECVG